MFVIFFDPSPILVVNQCFKSWVPQKHLCRIRWNFVPEISLWTPNWTVAWCWRRTISNFDMLSWESLRRIRAGVAAEIAKKYRMHGCWRGSLCVTVVSMIPDKCTVGTWWMWIAQQLLIYLLLEILFIEHYLSRSSFMIIALIQWTDIWVA